MSAEEPPPGLARKRLPFSPNEAPRTFAGTGRVMLYFYWIVAIGLSALTAHQLAVVRLSFTDPHVFVPALGAAWFAMRAFMMGAPRRGKGE